ncbi:MAG: 30S ribosomal protein S5 [bacterium]
MPRPQRNRKDHNIKDREFDQKVVDINRVTRVVAGGKRMRFRATVILGDGKGKVGYGVKKGADVSAAVSKASTAARKTMIQVPMEGSTIPHEVRVKFGAARVLLKPAPAGTGIIAGGPVRMVMELVGIKDVVTKMLGSQNKHNNVKATFVALKALRPPRKGKKGSVKKTEKISEPAEQTEEKSTNQEDKK